MPYIVRKKGNQWLTVNTETGKVKGRHKTKKLAIAQMRLLQGIESGWRPQKEKRDER